MMINVSGSISVINKVRKTILNLNAKVSENLALSSTANSPIFHLSDDENILQIKLINQDATGNIYDQLSHLEETSAITLIDNGSGEGLIDLLENKNHITRVLGLQGHCFKGDLQQFSDENIFRLNKIKDNTDISEIVLRTSDVAVFNMNAIRRGDQCGCLRSNTTGLSIEEACLIAKYIGASDLIKNVFFVGLNLNNDDYDMMSINLTNLLWYVQEGTELRKMDQNITNSENLVFSVVTEPFAEQLQFVKSTESGRWWVKVPTEDGHMHMACSKKDYEMACNNEISERITRAIESVI